VLLLAIQNKAAEHIAILTGRLGFAAGNIISEVVDYDIFVNYSVSATRFVDVASFFAAEVLGRRLAV